jgi:type I restriction enzyme S subunit
VKAGWEAKTLGEVILKTETVNPLASPNQDFEYIDVSSVSNATFQIQQTQRLKGKDAPSRARRVVKTDDVLLATIRPTLRRIALVPDELDNQVCSTGYAVLRSGPKLVPKYLFYYLFTEPFQLAMETLQKGASYPAVTEGEVRDQPLLLPPLPEQQRIVAILDEAFAAIATAKANAEKNLQNARALFESSLNSALSSPGPLWKATTLGAEVDLLSGFAFQSGKYTQAPDSIRLLRGDNIIQRAVRWEDVKNWPKSDCAQYERYFLQEGDVVVAMDRPWTKAGLKHAKLSGDDIPCLLVQRTCRLRCKPRIDRDFLYALLGSEAFTAHVLGSLTGIGVPHISGGQILSFPFHLPPLPLQLEVTQTLNSLRNETHRLESLYRRKIAALDELKKSLLHRAFNGDL